MAVKNSLAEKKEQPKFSVAIQGDTYKNLINSTLGDPDRAKRFVASVSSAVAVNPSLQECDAGTILSAALLGESLSLTPSPQLGQYYMVPYKKKDRYGNVVSVTAQFQLGYKGYIQLAIRSGYYKKINVLPIKQGELLGFNPLEEEISVRLMEDEEERENAPTIGYYAMFEYLNGFRKAIYWSLNKMEKHADKYSQAFSLKSYNDLKEGKIPAKEMWRYSSFWYKNFDEMACKTMLRQLISKWGIMSIELQKAFENDMGVLHENGTVDYVDNAEMPFVEEDTPPAEEPMEQPEYKAEEEAPKETPNAPQNVPPVVDDDEFFADIQ